MDTAIFYDANKQDYWLTKESLIIQITELVNSGNTSNTSLHVKDLQEIVFREYLAYSEKYLKGEHLIRITIISARFLS